MSPQEPTQSSSENVGNYKATYTSTQQAQPGVPQIIIQQASGSGWSRYFSRILLTFLIFSLILNMSLMSSTSSLMGDLSGPTEKHFKYYESNAAATDKIAIIHVNTTIMPPYTEKTFDVIEKIEKDDNVKAVVLAVDSPGGLVADSHEIYHKLKILAEKKPIYVSMRRLAASGGYYVSMGIGPKGKIFAEPTTWTGSIGVILPRYDISELANKIGVKSDPLTTGPFKDALSPFKPLEGEEREVWKGILDESYQRFVSVIEDNRTNMNRDQVLEVATGRIFTADQALEKGLIDKVGYLSDTIDALKADYNLDQVNVIEYEFSPTISDIIFGQASFKAPSSPLETLLDQSVPRAMYLFSWQTNQ